VIPMLPENLSNGICSLNPDVERLCMVCDMVITYAGNIKEYRFYPAVMRSHARLTYNQVWDWISDDLDHPHKAQIDTLYKLFKILQKKRFERGAMEFESVETQMLFDDNGKIEKIVPVVRNDAHKLIEECMLAANVCAAEFLMKNKHTALFRNHLGPTPEKLATLREQLGRVPRGVVGIAARCVCGRPVVVRTAPRLPDGSPFPTTYYLTHPAAVKGCSTLEAEHLMEEFNARLATDEALAAAYAAAHEDYLARRAELGRPEEIEGVSAGGMPARVKCLHALVGHALAAGRGVNPIGDLALAVLIERGLWDPARCLC